MRIVRKTVNIGDFRCREQHQARYIPYDDPLFDGEPRIGNTINTTYGGICYDMVRCYDDSGNTSGVTDTWLPYNEYGDTSTTVTRLYTRPELEISGDTSGCVNFEVVRYQDAYLGYADLRKQLGNALYLKGGGALINCETKMVDAQSEGTKIYTVCSPSDVFGNLENVSYPYQVLMPLYRSGAIILKTDLEYKGGDAYSYNCGSRCPNYLIAIDRMPDYVGEYFEFANGEVDGVIVPELSIPLLITSNIDKVGLLTDYLYSVDESGNTVDSQDYTEDTDEGMWLRNATETTLSELIKSYTESKLGTLKSPEATMDEATGIRKDYKMKYVNTGYAIQKVGDGTGESGFTDDYDIYLPPTKGDPNDYGTYWKVAAGNISGKNLILVPTLNGSVVDSNDSYTIASTVESAIMRLKAEYDTPGETYECLFNIQYENIKSYKPVIESGDTSGESGTTDEETPEPEYVYSGTPADFPYVPGNVFNVTGNRYDPDGYYGDVVISESADTEFSTVTFTYAIGASLDYNGTNFTYREGTGVIYTETYQWVEDVDYIMLDGIPNVPVLYKRLITDEAEVRSDSLSLSRMVSLCDDVTFTSNSVWANSNARINRPVFKDEKYSRFDFTPTVDTGIEFNRGNAAAFERHFKLSECNTVEDLENYGNDIFNLKNNS